MEKSVSGSIPNWLPLPRWMWILIKESRFGLSSYIKIGVVVILLLILVVGPLLQIYDCFNDPPTQDHDALLHTIDALLSIALILVIQCVLFWMLAIFWTIRDQLKHLKRLFLVLSWFQPTLSLSPQSLSLRI